MNFLIESCEHEYGGMHRVWWKPNRLGYTMCIEEAGRYSEDEAKEIVEKANMHGIKNEVMWSEEDVLSGKSGMKRIIILRGSSGGF